MDALRQIAGMLDVDFLIAVDDESQGILIYPIDHDQLQYTTECHLRQSHAEASHKALHVDSTRPQHGC